MGGVGGGLVGTEGSRFSKGIQRRGLGTYLSILVSGGRRRPWGIGGEGRVCM